METLDWNKQPPAPPLPDDVAKATTAALSRSLSTADWKKPLSSLTLLSDKDMRARLEALIEEMLDGQILLAEAMNEFEKLYIKQSPSP